MYACSGTTGSTSQQDSTSWGAGVTLALATTAAMVTSSVAADAAQPVVEGHASSSVAMYEVGSMYKYA